MVLALCLGHAWALGSRPADESRPCLLRAQGVVSVVHYRHYGQGFHLLVSAPEATRILPCRIFVAAPMVPAIRVGDTVAIAGLWSPAGRAGFRATRLSLVTPREVGSRGWAWQALGRLHRHEELATRLLLGQGGATDREIFRRSGLLHLLAVSGLHLGLVLLGCIWLLQRCGLPWWLRHVLLGALALAFCWLAGFGIPTRRATAMTLAILAARLTGRRPHPLAALSLAVLVLALWDPQDVTTASFQISVVAVLGIVTLGRQLITWRRRLLPLLPWPLDRPAWCLVLTGTRRSLDALAIGLAASVAVAPLIAWYFHQLNPWGAWASLAATPLLMAVLILGLPVLLLAGIWPAGPWSGLYLLWEWSLDALLGMVDVLARLPAGLLAVPAPSPWLALAWPLLFLPLRNRTDLVCRLLAVSGVLAVTLALPGTCIP